MLQCRRDLPAMVDIAYLGKHEYGHKRVYVGGCLAQHLVWFKSILQMTVLRGKAVVPTNVKPDISSLAYPPTLLLCAPGGQRTDGSFHVCHVTCESTTLGIGEKKSPNAYVQRCDKRRVNHAIIATWMGVK